MSTNPFRQTRNQQGPPGDNAFPPPDSRRAVSDGSGSRTADSSLDTKASSSFDRHVSFASPPVDTTYPAASYPSSPESVRSPASYFGQPATPNYRSAFLSDPFEDLDRDVRQDNTIQEALNNTQTNVFLGPTTPAPSEKTAERDTPSRPAAPQTSQPSRQSLDVDAFKRLLLTGDSGKSSPGTATPPVSKPASRVVTDSSSGTDTASLSQLSMHDATNRKDSDTPRSSHEQDRDADNKAKVPPPRPAPRRAQSSKTKPPQQAPAAEVPVAQGNIDTSTTSQEKPTRKPPTPPLARRRSHRTPSFRSEEHVSLSAEASHLPNSSKGNHRALPPPPPPLRKQHSTSQRRPSNDLAPTIEELETEPAASSDSRRSSSDRVVLPLARSSSQSVKRQSLGSMNPPSVPPPRRGSNRSSVDSFRPSLSSIIGEEDGQENIAVRESSRRSSIREQTKFDPSNADSIMAELANLQKEVDAARGGA